MQRLSCLPVGTQPGNRGDVLQLFDPHDHEPSRCKPDLYFFDRYDRETLSRDRRSVLDGPETRSACWWKNPHHEEAAAMGVVLHWFLPTNGDSRTDLSLGNAVGAAGTRVASGGTERAPDVGYIGQIARSARSEERRVGKEVG